MFLSLFISMPHSRNRASVSLSLRCPQVGLVVYGRQPVTVFELDTHDSGSAILRAVKQASFQGGAASTGSALLHVLANSLTVGRGARPGVNKAVVVLTDGSGAEDAAVPARKLRDNGVAVFAVGIGDVQTESLLKITGRVEHMVTVPFYEDLKYFEDVLVQMVCAGEKVEERESVCVWRWCSGVWRWL